MDPEPTEDERRLMAQYGIEAEPKTVYRYKGHTYEHLGHALSYAKIDAARPSTEAGKTSPQAPRGLRKLWLKAAHRDH